VHISSSCSSLSQSEVQLTVLDQSIKKKPISLLFDTRVHHYHTQQRHIGKKKMSFFSRFQVFNPYKYILKIIGNKNNLNLFFSCVYTGQGNEYFLLEDFSFEI
jgi:hypothetical protein